jgi:hypothetical protein
LYSEAANQRRTDNIIVKKGNKKTNNYLQAPHRKTEIEQHELHMKAGGLAL